MTGQVKLHRFGLYAGYAHTLTISELSQFGR